MTSTTSTFQVAAQRTGRLCPPGEAMEHFNVSSLEIVEEPSSYIFVGFDPAPQGYARPSSSSPSPPLPHCPPTTSFATSSARSSSPPRTISTVTARRSLCPRRLSSCCTGHLLSLVRELRRFTGPAVPRLRGGCQGRHHVALLCGGRAEAQRSRSRYSLAQRLRDRLAARSAVGEDVVLGSLPKCTEFRRWINQGVPRS